MIFERIGAVAGGITSAIIVLLLIGGTVYRTTCPGYVIWGIQGQVPYFAPAPDGCQRHSSTRILLSHLGLFPFED